MGKDERYYDSGKLTVIFACAALILLSALGLLFLKDYTRQWKDYQASFHTLEIEKTRVKLDKANLEAQNDPEYKEVHEAYQKALDEFNQSCQETEVVAKELSELKAADDIAQQKYKFTKAELDAAKYRYEATKAHPNPNIDLEQLKTEYYGLDNTTTNLKIAAEETQDALKQKQAEADRCGEQLREVEKKKRRVDSQLSILERKLKNIDPSYMNPANQTAELVRNLPVIDLANPTLKIQQIVLKDIGEDVNFTTVPRVDRCITCHLGVDNADYAVNDQPFKAHPRLEEFVGKNSPHPMEEFGCTVCHGGRGRGTDFITSAHTPRDEKQKKEWEEKYDWHEIELWEEPMFPLQYVEAGCFKCHSDQGTIKGAEKLNLGLQVIEKAGCYNCHVIDKYQDWPKSGPDLTQIKSKLSKEWAYKWIESPQSFRHNTWMPAYFDQTNNNDPASIARGHQEIHSIVAYLFSKSKEYPAKKVQFKGEAKKGEELVASLGCFACHKVQKDPTDTTTTAASLRQEFGPNLIGMGSKASKEWVYNWLKDPSSYHKDTRMPNMRLSDQEAMDITEYLTSDTISKFDAASVPPVDNKIIDQITMDILLKSNTQDQAKNKLAAMSLDDKLSFNGQRLIGQYGCYSCHNIDGFEKAKPIGVELTEEGSKNAHLLDFGFVHIDHTKQAWFTQKLQDPRIFDKGKLKAPDEKLIMPNFYLEDEEIEAAVTALLGFTKDVTVKNKKPVKTPEDFLIQEGEKIVKQMNCQGCHLIEGEGASIKDSVKDWLIKFQGTSDGDAEKFTDSFSPPDLLGVGAKVDPQWLFNFIHEPTTQVRPWLKVRMPSYGFNASHLNALVKFFNALDKTEFPFIEKVNTALSAEEYKAAEKLFSPEYFDCIKCHVVGDQMPSGTQDTWAPDLSLAKTRLNPKWMIDWIRNPTALVPGTKMPTFFDPDNYEKSGPEDILNGDEDEQIRVLRNYLLQLSDKKPSVPAAVSK